MNHWKNKNSGLHPSDPAFDPDYDSEEDFDRYMDEVELKEQIKKEK